MLELIIGRAGRTPACVKRKRRCRSSANFVHDRGKINLVTVKRLGLDRSGTGDAFFAVLAGYLLNGCDLIDAVRKAADFVSECIEYAERLDLPWNHGLPFEEFLTTLK